MPRVLRAALDHWRLAPTDDGGAHAGVDQHLDAVAVQGVEGLEFAAVGEKVQATVGQYAIHIEDGQADVTCALQKMFVHYMTPHAAGQACSGRRWQPCSSITTNELILWSSMIFSASAASISALAVLP